MGWPEDGRSPDEVVPTAPQVSGSRRTAESIREWLVTRLAHETGAAPDEVTTSEPFAYYGIDSPSAAGLVGELGDWLGRRVAMSVLYNHPTIDALAAHLAAGLSSEPASEATAVRRVLSPSQPIGGVGVRVTAIGVEIPPCVVTTKEVEERAGICRRFGYKPGWLELSTGVRERRWAGADTLPSDLAIMAGIKALRKARIDPETLDAVIFGGISRDFLEPAVANVVAEGVGARRALAFDVSNACNGMIQSLDVADSMIRCGKAARVLVTSGERGSIGYNWEPQSFEDLIHSVAAYMLGDGGAALVVEATDDADRGIQQRVVRTDASRWRLAIGCRFRPAEPCAECGRIIDRVVRCNGPEIQEVAFEMIVPVLAEAMERTGWSDDDLDLFFCHEASRRFVDAVLQGADGHPSLWSKAWRIVERYGNTSSVSLPLGMSAAEAAGALVPGKRIMLCGPGAGITIFAVTMIW